MTQDATPIQGGFITLARKLLASPTWIGLTPAQRSVMITLLLLANWRPSRFRSQVLGREIVVPRGSLLASQRAIAEKAGVTRKVVVAALARLEATGFIRRNQLHAGYQRPKLIEIVNYEAYQDATQYVAGGHGEGSRGEAVAPSRVSALAPSGANTPETDMPVDPSGDQGVDPSGVQKYPTVDPSGVTSEEYRRREKERLPAADVDRSTSRRQPSRAPSPERAPAPAAVKRAHLASDEAARRPSGSLPAGSAAPPPPLATEPRPVFPTGPGGPKAGTDTPTVDGEAGPDSAAWSTGNGSPSKRTKRGRKPKQSSLDTCPVPPGERYALVDELRQRILAVDPNNASCSGGWTKTRGCWAGQLKRALEEGHTLERLREAMDLAFADEWWRGRITGMAQLLRTADAIVQSHRASSQCGGRNGAADERVPLRLGAE